MRTYLAVDCADALLIVAVALDIDVLALANEWLVAGLGGRIILLFSGISAS